MPKICVIGSGFSGLSAAAYLSAAGHEVHIFEKNDSLGGRARQFSTSEGYVFDMGPSWYWMPDVFEKFFNDFGLQVSDHYQLKQLDPAFDIIYAGSQKMSIPASYDKLGDLFESLEPGSKRNLQKFMDEAAYKYKVGVQKLVYKPGLSLLELFDRDILSGIFKLQIFTSFHHHVRKYFKHPQILALMDFPVLFLGATSKQIPALYSLMNYAGLKLGTWYPMGGFGKVVDAMANVSIKNGAVIHLSSDVKKLNVDRNHVRSIFVNDKTLQFDAVIGTADYHHIENRLLNPEFRNYEQQYWENRVLAPSALIFYLGINKKIKNLQHHTLFFDTDMAIHANEIYSDKQWPSNPLFYVCCPSQTDSTVAPEGHENLFILMPLANEMVDHTDIREKYFSIIISRLERQIGESISPFIDFKKSYCIKDFVTDYNSYKGNAYGLANTLLQTANLKPKLANKKVKNLYYAGQLTVPGPGVPTSIISGKLAAEQLIKKLKETIS